MRHYTKKLKIPIFPGEVTFIIADNLKRAFVDYHDFDESSCEDWDNYEGLHTHGTDEGMPVYWIAIEAHNLKISTITHECNHCALRMFHNIGQPGPQSDSDEIFCYVQGWIVGEFVRFINENRLKSKVIFE